MRQPFRGFLLSPVAPDWNDEATATLSFAMGALVEKMQMLPYCPEFSAGLGEVLTYLDFYGEDEAVAESRTEPAPRPRRRRRRRSCYGKKPTRRGSAHGDCGGRVTPPD